MNPPFFPTEELKALYNELESLKSSEDKRFKPLLDFNLAYTFRVNDKLHFIHPNTPTQLFSFKTPPIDPSIINPSTVTREAISRMTAMKDFMALFVFSDTISDSERNLTVLQKHKRWYAFHVQALCFVSIPTPLEEEAKTSIKRTEAVGLTFLRPDVCMQSCSGCHAPTLVYNDDVTFTCDCGMTSIIEIVKT